MSNFADPYGDSFQERFDGNGKGKEKDDRGPETPISTTRRTTRGPFDRTPIGFGRPGDSARRKQERERLSFNSPQGTPGLGRSETRSGAPLRSEEEKGPLVKQSERKTSNVIFDAVKITTGLTDEDFLDLVSALSVILTPGSKAHEFTERQRHVIEVVTGRHEQKSFTRAAKMDTEELMNMANTIDRGLDIHLFRDLVLTDFERIPGMTFDKFLNRTTTEQQFILSKVASLKAENSRLTGGEEVGEFFKKMGSMKKLSLVRGEIPEKKEDKTTDHRLSVSPFYSIDVPGLRYDYGDRNDNMLVDERKEETFGKHSNYSVHGFVQKTIRGMEEVLSQKYPIVGDSKAYFRCPLPDYENDEADVFVEDVKLISDRKRFLKVADSNKVFVGRSVDGYKSWIDIEDYPSVPDLEQVRYLFQQYGVIRYRIRRYVRMYEGANRHVRDSKYLFDIITTSLEVDPDAPLDDGSTVRQIRDYLAGVVEESLKGLPEYIEKLRSGWMESGLDRFIDETYEKFEKLRRVGYDRGRPLKKESKGEFNKQQDEGITLLSQLVGDEDEGREVDWNELNRLPENPGEFFMGPPEVPYVHKSTRYWIDREKEGEGDRSFVEIKHLDEENEEDRYGVYDSVDCDLSNPFDRYDRIRAFVERMRTLMYFLDQLTPALKRLLDYNTLECRKPVFVYYANYDETGEVDGVDTGSTYNWGGSDGVSERRRPVPFPDLIRDLPPSFSMEGAPLICANRLINQFLNSEASAVNGGSISGYPGIGGGHDYESGVECIDPERELRDLMEVVLECPMLFVSCNRVADGQGGRNDGGDGVIFSHARSLMRLHLAYSMFNLAPEGRVLVWRLLLCDKTLTEDLEGVRKNGVQIGKLFSKTSEVDIQTTTGRGPEEYPRLLDGLGTIGKNREWFVEVAPGRMHKIVCSVLRVMKDEKYQPEGIGNGTCRSFRLAYMNSVGFGREVLKGSEDPDMYRRAAGVSQIRNKLGEYWKGIDGSIKRNGVWTPRRLMTESYDCDLTRMLADHPAVQINCVVRCLKKLPICKGEEGSRLKKTEAELLKKSMLFKTGMHEDERAFLAGCGSELGIFVQLFVKKFYWNFGVDYGTLSKDTSILSVSEDIYANASDAVKSGRLPKGLLMKEIPEKRWNGKVDRATIVKLLQLIAKDTKNLVKYILHVPSSEDKTVAGVTGTWSLSCSALAGTLITEIVNLWDLSGGLNGKIYDDCVVPMILLLKLIDVYYRIGAPTRIPLFSVGDPMRTLVQNDTDGRVSERFKDMRSRYMRKFAPDKDTAGYSSIRSECDAKMHAVLGFSNPSLDRRFVSMYAVLGGSAMDKLAREETLRRALSDERRRVKSIDIGNDLLEIYARADLMIENGAFFVIHNSNDLSSLRPDLKEKEPWSIIDREVLSHLQVIGETSGKERVLWNLDVKETVLDTNIKSVFKVGEPVIAYPDRYLGRVVNGGIEGDGGREKSRVYNALDKLHGKKVKHEDDHVTAPSVNYDDAFERSGEQIKGETRMFGLGLNRRSHVHKLSQHDSAWISGGNFLRFVYYSVLMKEVRGLYETSALNRSGSFVSFADSVLYGDGDSETSMLNLTAVFKQSDDSSGYTPAGPTFEPSTPVSFSRLYHPDFRYDPSRFSPGVYSRKEENYSTPRRPSGIKGDFDVSLTPIQRRYEPSVQDNTGTIPQWNQINFDSFSQSSMAEGETAIYGESGYVPANVRSPDSNRFGGDADKTKEWSETDESIFGQDESVGRNNTSAVYYGDADLRNAMGLRDGIASERKNDEQRLSSGKGETNDKGTLSKKFLEKNLIGLTDPMVADKVVKRISYEPVEVTPVKIRSLGDRGADSPFGVSPGNRARTVVGYKPVLPDDNNPWGGLLDQSGGGISGLSMTNVDYYLPDIMIRYGSMEYGYLCDPKMEMVLEPMEW